MIQAEPFFDLPNTSNKSFAHTSGLEIQEWDLIIKLDYILVSDTYVCLLILRSKSSEIAVKSLR